VSSTLPGKGDRRALMWTWAILFAAIAVLRITTPPARGLDRRLGVDEAFGLAILLGAGPLAIFGLGATAAYVWLRGRRSWWTYHVSLALMGAVIAFTAAYANWNSGWSVAYVWVTLSYANEFLFTPFWVFAVSLLIMAVAPSAVSAIRRTREAGH
jgi:hypothetical protein